MNTTELMQLLQHDPYVSPYFQGVFASDQLPHHRQTGITSFVVNTDPASRSGQHWIAIFIYPDCASGHYIGEYFDSYGDEVPIPRNIRQFLKRNVSSIQRNVKALQSFYGITCGAFCVYFLKHRHRGQSLLSITRRFGKNRKNNDFRITRWIRETYKRLRKQRRHIPALGDPV